MITNNEFLTLRAIQHNFTLTSAGIAIELKRNNVYYFNNNGIAIEIYATRKDVVDDTPLRYIWFPSYEYTLSHVDGDILRISEQEYTVVVGDLFTTNIDVIDLFTSGAETERDKRAYSNLSVIEVSQIDENLGATEFISTKTKVLEIKLPINTTPLPLPYLKAFDLDLIDQDTARISWKGTNPGDFYYYELWDSWDPITPLLRARVNTATGQYFHTFGKVAKGKYNIFTLKIVRDGIIYAERQIKILLPRDDFNIYHRIPDLRYTDAIYLIEDDPTGENPNIKTPIAFVWFKAGNAWYTD